MAYSNWGAWVHRNGEARHDREDVAVWNTAEADVPAALSIWTNLLRLREEYGETGEAPAYERAHHAVLGDGYVRLCGYKDWARLFVAWPENKVEQVEIPSPYDQEEAEGTVDMGELGQWKWSYDHDGTNRIDLRLVEPDGTIWNATSGYCFGAGWD